MFTHYDDSVSDLEDLNLVLTREDPELDKNHELLSFTIEDDFEFLGAEKNILEVINQLRELVSKNITFKRENWVKKEASHSKKEESEKEEIGEESDFLVEEEEDESKFKEYKETIKVVFKNNNQNFLKARELYKTVQNSNSREGYFYKLSDKRRVGEIFAIEFDNLNEKILRDLNYASEYLGELLLSGNEEQKIIAKRLMEMNFLGVIQGINSLSDMEDELNVNLQQMYIKGVRGNIINLSKQIYFQEMERKGDELENSGSVYKPEGFHSWGVNLAWVLAHLKKGTRFIIISDVVRNQYRRSPDAYRLVPDDAIKKVKEHSAFLREICVCLKAGYELCYVGEKTTLYPSEDYTPEKCVTNGLEGNGVNPSYQEVEHIFQELKKGYSFKQNFSFDLKKGVKILDGQGSSSILDQSRSSRVLVAPSHQQSINIQGSEEEVKIKIEERLASVNNRFSQDLVASSHQGIAAERTSVSSLPESNTNISCWTSLWNSICCRKNRKSKESLDIQQKNLGIDERREPKR